MKTCRSAAGQRFWLHFTAIRSACCFSFFTFLFSAGQIFWAHLQLVVSETPSAPLSVTAEAVCWSNIPCVGCFCCAAEASVSHDSSCCLTENRSCRQTPRSPPGCSCFTIRPNVPVNNRRTSEDEDVPLRQTAWTRMWSCLYELQI